MMKKFVSILLAALSLPAMAQEGADYVKALVENNRVSFSYTLSPKGHKKVKMEGKAVIDGDCYRLHGNELEILCNGETKWTIDTAAKEVYIEAAESTRDFIANMPGWISNVKDLKVSGTTVSGTYEDASQDQAMSFKFSSISSSPLSGSTEGFSYDTAPLGGDWVITDLR